ncbi:MAG: hypothetical protein ACYDGN_01595 [Acidimicrobiales bacterium]
MVPPGRDRLSGGVEVDETVLGAPGPRLPGRCALGKTMVERAERRFGRTSASHGLPI